VARLGKEELLRERCRANRLGPKQPHPGRTL